MKVYEAIKYIEQHNHIDDVVKDMCIEALEKQIKLEEVLARLEKLKYLFDEENCQIRYESYCKPKGEKCKTKNCFECVLSEAIEIIKEGMG